MVQLWQALGDAPDLPLVTARTRHEGLRNAEATGVRSVEPVGDVAAGSRGVKVPSAAERVAAAAAVEAHLAPTPLLDQGDGLVLKVETLQPTGSFKVRGAIAALSAVRSEDPGARVVTASAGNHALALAWAAQRLGVAATVVLPETASVTKLAALARFEADVVRAGTCYDDAEAHALNLAHEGMRFVSPYNDTCVIAGHASLGAELLGQRPDLRRVVVPVGGGGLVSGLALALSGSDAHVVGVEVDGLATMRAAAGAGHAVRLDLPPTLADGLAGNLEPGSVTIDVVREHQVELVAVRERDIPVAMRWLATHAGLFVEGSGAVALAAVLSGSLPRTSGSTAVVLTGRNIGIKQWAGVTA